MSTIRNHIDLTNWLRDHDKPAGANHNLDSAFFGGACWCAIGVDEGSPDECDVHGAEHVATFQGAGYEGNVATLCRLCTDARIAHRFELEPAIEIAAREAS